MRDQNTEDTIPSYTIDLDRRADVIAIAKTALLHNKLC